MIHYKSGELMSTSPGQALAGTIRDGTRRRLLLSYVALASMSLLAAPAPAAVIALYPFDTISSNSSASTDLDPNSAASSISAGAGVTMVSSGTGNPAPSGAMQNATAANEAGAVAGGDYFEFSITPNSGFELSLMSLNLQYMRNNLSGPTNLIVRSSLDSFNANLFSDASISASSFETGTLTLASLAEFQEVDSAITFRIYAWGGGLGTSLRLDNIALNGDLNAIPEPSIFAITLTGLGAAVFPRRRRRVGFP